MSTHRPRSSRRRALALALVAATALTGLLAPAASAKPQNVKVMTRNIYLGADLTGALTAPDAPSAFLAAGEIYRDIHDTNFPARARLLTQEIANTKPDLIGLQEVALWRRGQVGAPDGPATPSEEVVYDFLETLMDRLQDAGLDYRVVVKQAEADMELPVDLNGGGPDFDGRLTMHDVILAKDSRNLRLKNRQSANYTSFLPAPTALGTINVLRGYTAVDVTKGKRKGKPRSGKTFRFVNTHLEAFTAFHRLNQANELIAPGGALDTDLPVILVGDLNSDPDDPTSNPAGVPTPNAAAYNAVVGTEDPADGGFADRGVTVNTCCHDADLRNDTPGFDSRIDHILSRGPVSKVGATLIGVDPALRTPTELWPSDHGGVVGTLRVR